MIKLLFRRQLASRDDDDLPAVRVIADDFDDAVASDVRKVLGLDGSALGRVGVVHNRRQRRLLAKRRAWDKRPVGRERDTVESAQLFFKVLLDSPVRYWRFRIVCLAFLVLLHCEERNENVNERHYDIEDKQRRQLVQRVITRAS